MDLAARLNLGDHNVGVKVNNSGAAHFLFGWRHNSAITAQLGFGAQLPDIAKGKLASFPLSFQFDANY